MNKRRFWHGPSFRARGKGDGVRTGDTKVATSAAKERGVEEKLGGVKRAEM